MAIYLDPKEEALATAIFEPKEMDGLVLRTLRPDDYNAGFCELLGQLTTMGEIPFEFFERRMHEIEASKRQYMLVIEDTETGQIVATGTLLIERKFIHQAGLAGHIEDVGVHSFYSTRELFSPFQNICVPLFLLHHTVALSDSSVRYCHDDIVVF